MGSEMAAKVEGSSEREGRRRGAAAQLCPMASPRGLLPSPGLFSCMEQPDLLLISYSSFHLRPCPYQHVLNDVQPQAAGANWNQGSE